MNKNVVVDIDHDGASDSYMNAWNNELGFGWMKVAMDVTNQKGTKTEKLSVAKECE